MRAAVMGVSTKPDFTSSSRTPADATLFPNPCVNVDKPLFAVL